jgi:hypothetical protein
LLLFSAVLKSLMQLLSLKTLQLILPLNFAVILRCFWT